MTADSVSAKEEARKLKIPVFGIVDTNCDPDLVDYVIPANDDAVRAVKLVIGALTNAIAEVNGNELMDCVSPEDQKKDSKKEKQDVEEEIKEVKEEKKESKKVEKEEPKKTTKKEEKKEEVKEEKPAKKETKKVEKEDLSSKTLTELKAIAKEKGLKGYSTMKKADLVAALK